jgi:hypothetical protein
MNKDRIGGLILVLGLLALLCFEALNYARKTSPFSLVKSAQSALPSEAQSQVTTNAVPQGTETSGVSGADASKSAEIPADWSTFTVDEYGFQISRPANWPVKMSGNVLTVGDPEGDGHTKCYVTIEFQGSKESGQLIPAANTHNSYEQMEQGEKCSATLAQVVKTGKFLK